MQNIRRLKKFPTQWKIGVLTPIYKDGSRRDVTNYRPVTLLNIISKVVEKPMFSSISTAFLEVVSEWQDFFQGNPLSPN